MVTSVAGPEPDFDDEQTVVDGTPFEEGVTPVEPSLCVECGGIVFADNAALVSFPDDRCIRALDAHFHWCHRLRKAVTYVPR